MKCFPRPASIAMPIEMLVAVVTSNESMLKASSRPKLPLERKVREVNRRNTNTAETCIVRKFYEKITIEEYHSLNASAVRDQVMPLRIGPRSFMPCSIFIVALANRPF